MVMSLYELNILEQDEKQYTNTVAIRIKRTLFLSEK